MASLVVFSISLTATAQESSPGQVLQSLNPDIALIADVALAVFSAAPEDVPALQAGGHDAQKNGFNFQGLELSAGKAVDPYFRFDANLVFGAEGVEIEEAYATTLGLPGQLQVRAGKFLTRFGRLNPTHLHVWDFSDQPFVLSRVFGGEGNRGVGLEGSWLLPLPWYVELVASATEASGEGTTRSFQDENPDFFVQGPLDVQGTVALKQFFALSDDWSLLWGLSGAEGPNPTGPRTRSWIAGTDVYLKYRPLSGGSTTQVALQAEGFWRVREVPDGVLEDFGLYAYLSWRFAQRWTAAVRYELGTPARDGSGAVAADYLDPDWTANRQRFSATLTFRPTEFSRLRLQASVDRPGWWPRPNVAVLLTLGVAVGAHGAHTF